MELGLLGEFSKWPFGGRRAIPYEEVVYEVYRMKDI